MNDVATARVRAALAGAPAAPPPQPPSAPTTSRFNTHFVGLTGMRAVWAAVGLHSAASIADAHLGTGSTLRIVLDAVQTYAVPALAASGGYAAYRGRPRDVTPDDATQVAIADAVGAPRPLTPV